MKCERRIRSDSASLQANATLRLVEEADEDGVVTKVLWMNDNLYLSI